MRHFLFAVLCLALTGDLPAQQTSDPIDQNKNAPAPVTRPALRDELLALMKEDQVARSELVRAMNEARTEGSSENGGVVILTADANKAMKGVAEIDKKSRGRLKAFIAEFGWPGRSLVGQEAAHAAWLLVQHADADVEFQKHCLGLMKQAPAGEVAATDIAYLTDRTLIAEGKEQVYGTQLDSNFEAKSIFDPENVDKRRAEIGMPPLAEYMARTKAFYQGSESGNDETEQKDTATNKGK